MSLDLLDLLLIAHYCFDKPVPWWFWGIGIIASIGGNMRAERLIKAERT